MVATVVWGANGLPADCPNAGNAGTVHNTPIDAAKATNAIAECDRSGLPSAGEAEPGSELRDVVTGSPYAVNRFASRTPW